MRLGQQKRWVGQEGRLLCKRANGVDVGLVRCFDREVRQRREGGAGEIQLIAMDEGSVRGTLLAERWHSYRLTRMDWVGMHKHKNKKLCSSRVFLTSTNPVSTLGRRVGLSPSL